MKTILAFSGSLSADSINHRLVEYTASLLPLHRVQVIRLSDFEAPLYRKELETANGIPEGIQRLRKLFDGADAFIVSTPEYNSSIPAGFKNTIDWLSRMEGKVFQQKPVLLMATSMGGRGGRSVLDHLTPIIPFWGAQLIGPFSLPKFGDNFQNEGIVEAELKSRLNDLILELQGALGS